MIRVLVRQIGIRIVGTVLALVSVLCPRQAAATSVRPVNLEEMTARASRIVLGRCADIVEIRDPASGLLVSRATFAVDRVVKGGVGSTLTVTTPRFDRDRPGDSGALDDLTYRRGEEVLLFLYGDSAMGFASPVGLGQGRFELIRDKQGRAMLVNATGNRYVFRGLTSDARRRISIPGSQDEPGAIELESFLSMIKSLLPPAARATTHHANPGR